MNDSLQAAAARCAELRQEIGGETAGAKMLLATEAALARLQTLAEGDPAPDDVSLFGLTGTGAATAARVLRSASSEEAAHVAETCFAVWKISSMGLLTVKEKA